MAAKRLNITSQFLVIDLFPIFLMSSNYAYYACYNFHISFEMRLFCALSYYRISTHIMNKIVCLKMSKEKNYINHNTVKYFLNVNSRTENFDITWFEHWQLHYLVGTLSVPHLPIWPVRTCVDLWYFCLFVLF